MRADSRKPRKLEPIETVRLEKNYENRESWTKLRKLDPTAGARLEKVENDNKTQENANLSKVSGSRKPDPAEAVGLEFSSPIGFVGAVDFASNSGAQKI